MDLSSYASFFEILYQDEMDVTSMESSTDSDGATTNAYPETPQQVNIPCRISLSSKDSPLQSSPYEKVELNPVIFCALGVQIQPGDKITVRRKHENGTTYDTYEGLVSISGRPNRWSTHQEFELDMKGDA